MMKYKICSNKLDVFSNNLKGLEYYFGNWVGNASVISSLHKSYSRAKPFPHIIIDNFLNDKYANKLYENIPGINQDWHHYNNPMEVKYAYDNIEQMDSHLKEYFYLLSSQRITNIFKKITGISNLEYDPYLHGAGVHKHPRNGRLGMHLDYAIHPITLKERRLNIILYMSKNWNTEEWGGDTQLWNQDMTKCVVKSPVIFNRAIVFRTDNYSWHGLPEKIQCPEGQYRQSLAYYYVSPHNTTKNKKQIRDHDTLRYKAQFVKRPQDPEDIRMKKLYDIRPHRRITSDDMNEIWPEWNPEDY